MRGPTMRLSALAVPLLLALASCAAPPPDAYVSRGGLAPTDSAITLGPDANGESCRQIQFGGGEQANIYCGSWQQPAGHVRSGVSPSETPADIAASSPWRSGLDLRYSCGAPERTTILGDQAAALL